jgi:hypothetical protein
MPTPLASSKAIEVEFSWIVINQSAMETGSPSTGKSNTRTSDPGGKLKSKGSPTSTLPVLVDVFANAM